MINLVGEQWFSTFFEIETKLKIHCKTLWKNQTDSQSDAIQNYNKGKTTFSFTIVNSTQGSTWGLIYVTRFSYTAVFYLTRFFKTKNRVKIPSNTVFKPISVKKIFFCQKKILVKFKFFFRQTFLFIKCPIVVKQGYISCRWYGEFYVNVYNFTNNVSMNSFRFFCFRLFHRNCGRVSVGNLNIKIAHLQV